MATGAPVTDPFTDTEKALRLLKDSLKNFKPGPDLERAKQRLEEFERILGYCQAKSN